MSKPEKLTLQERVEHLVVRLNIAWSFMCHYRDSGSITMDGYPHNTGMEYCTEYRYIVYTLSEMGARIRRLKDGSHEISILGVTAHTEKGLF